ncbi:hypothetical protein HSBGL_0877 [Halapricum desulfuricans]|uniref:Uncharacterized protein n=1 Tax=Halapricum desulfuricans TaxID=2841257 RepID=A0A897NF40_9EURY|nr:hypothetical protein HSBGL_0877 [Halapricum desulfuricans]
MRGFLKASVATPASEARASRRLEPTADPPMNAHRSEPHDDPSIGFEHYHEDGIEEAMLDE